jgi:hypothetical protein
MLPDLEELYKPYSKDADLETTLLYWQKEATNLGINHEIKDAIIAEVFLEMANGKTFEIGTCTCGCDFPIEWSCVDLNHYALNKMKAAKKEMNAMLSDALKAKVHGHMLNIISKENENYVTEMMKPKRIFDWKRSPVLRWIGLA